MRKDRILALADLIEKQPHTSPEANEGFSMAGFEHESGTPCCIGGWAAWESMGRPAKLCDSILVGSEARKYLGIDTEQSDALFWPLGYESNEITPLQASVTLRHLAEAGEVDWSARSSTLSGE